VVLSVADHVAWAHMVVEGGCGSVDEPTAPPSPGTNVE